MADASGRLVDDDTDTVKKRVKVSVSYLFILSFIVVLHFFLQQNTNLFQFYRRHTSRPKARAVRR